MNITSRPRAPRTASRVTRVPVVTSDNWKSGASVPSSGIVEGVSTMVSPSLAALAGLEALQELDLAGVIEVVSGGAADEAALRPAGAARFARKVGIREARDDLKEHLVLTLEEAHVGAEGTVAAVRLRAREPIAALEGERAALLSGEPPAHHVLPVRRVHDELPDVVTLGMRTPERRLGVDAADRAAEVRPVPGRMIVGFAEKDQ